jgi:uncharacterized protein (TIGR02466 family)
MRNINLLFPKSVFQVNDWMLDSLAKFETRINELKDTITLQRMQAFNVKSSRYSGHDLHKEPVFSDFVDGLMGHFSYYMTELGLEHLVGSCEIQNMWFNISRREEGAYNFPHVHRESLISGVYYVKSSELDKIIFYDDITSTYPESKNFYKTLNKSTKEIACVPGRLLMFKSDFVHSNLQQESEEKIAISFNIGNAKNK